MVVRAAVMKLQARFDLCGNGPHRLAARLSPDGPHWVINSISLFTGVICCSEYAALSIPTSLLSDAASEADSY